MKETICMKCQILFSGKNKKKITNLSSAELAKRVIISNYIQNEVISFGNITVFSLLSDCNRILSRKLSYSFVLGILNFESLTLIKVTAMAAKAGTITSGNEMKIKWNYNSKCRDFIHFKSIMRYRFSLIKSNLMNNMDCKKVSALKKKKKKKKLKIES